MASAEFGVGGDGEVALGAGGLFPVGSVSHDGSEDSFTPTVGIVEGAVAGGALLVPAAVPG